MDELDNNVELALVRGIGAYLKATSPSDLPASLRRFRGFHSKGLASRRRELLAAFEHDEGLRARIVEWLDDKPTLPKKDAHLLRVAAARDDGWQEALRATSKPLGRLSSKSASQSQSSDLLERERERTRKARDEARRAKDEAKLRVDKAHKEMAELRRQLADARRSETATANAIKTAHAEREKALGELERERRKRRAELDKHKTSLENLRAELRSLRSELRHRTSEVTQLQTRIDSLTQPSKRVGKTASAPGGPRRPLKAPKGRLDSAPETLEEWLKEGDVHLLVDGYNASMSKKGFPGLKLEDQRERLVDVLSKLARRTGVKVTVVFDGSDVDSRPRPRRRSVTVQYSNPDEIADDHLVALLESLPPHPVIVVTSDKDLQRRAKEKGATIATSEQLLATLR
jgi:predicted RNA-binding protein with PIN domain